MKVTFSEILTQYAMQEIDDINWVRELAVSPARFLRAKSDMLIMAIPYFSRPIQMQEWLKYKPPSYDDYLYTATRDETAPIVIATGKTNYELCSAVITTEDAVGNVTVTTVAAEYDAETGNVTVNQNLTAGQKVDMDFYTDGVFEYALDPEQCRILGTCVAYVWNTRFANKWLNMQPKIADNSFKVGSESAHITAETARLKELRLALNDTLLHYEQNLNRRQNATVFSKLKSPVRAAANVSQKAAYVPVYVLNTEGNG